MQAKSKKVLKTKEVAKLLNISKPTLYNLIHEGEINAVRVGRSFRITEEEFIAFLRKRSGVKQKLESAEIFEHLLKVSPQEVFPPLTSAFEEAVGPMWNNKGMISVSVGKPEDYEARDLLYRVATGELGQIVPASEVPILTIHGITFEAHEPNVKIARKEVDNIELLGDVLVLKIRSLADDSFDFRAFGELRVIDEYLYLELNKFGKEFFALLHKFKK